MCIKLKFNHTKHLNFCSSCYFRVNNLNISQTFSLFHSINAIRCLSPRFVGVFDDRMICVCFQEQLDEHRPGQELEEGWILVCKHTEGGDRLVPVESPETVSRQQQLFGYDHKPCDRWEQVVDVENVLYIGSKPKIAECDAESVQKLRWAFFIIMILHEVTVECGGF